MSLLINQNNMGYLPTANVQRSASYYDNLIEQNKRTFQNVMSTLNTLVKLVQDRQQATTTITPVPSLSHQQQDTPNISRSTFCSSSNEVESSNDTNTAITALQEDFKREVKQAEPQPHYKDNIYQPKCDLPSEIDLKPKMLGDIPFPTETNFPTDTKVVKLINNQDELQQRINFRASTEYTFYNMEDNISDSQRTTDNKDDIFPSQHVDMESAIVINISKHNEEMVSLLQEVQSQDLPPTSPELQLRLSELHDDVFSIRHNVLPLHQRFDENTQFIGGVT